MAHYPFTLIDFSSPHLPYLTLPHLTQLPAVLVVAPVLSAAALYLELNAWNARDVAEVRQRLPATAPPPTITLPSGPLTAAAALCALPVLASLSQLAATGQLQWLMMGGTCALSAYCLYGWVSGQVSECMGCV